MVGGRGKSFPSIRWRQLSAAVLAVKMDLTVVT